jgi:hypothetical protein
LREGGVAPSCENTLLETFLPTKASTDSLDVEELKSWYLENQLLRAAKTQKKKVFKRKLDWSKSKKVKDKDNKECIVLNIDYETDVRPSFMSYTEDTEFRKGMAKYYFQPIYEIAVGYKVKGKIEMYYYQISYDRYTNKLTNKKLDLSKLNGWLLRADINDELLNAVQLKSGKKTKHFNQSITGKKARPACGEWVDLGYQEVYGHSCGDSCIEITVTWHSNWTFVACEGGQEELPWDHNVNQGDDGSGSGDYAWYYDVPSKGYDSKKAFCSPGADRDSFNQKLEDAASGTV